MAKGPLTGGGAACGTCTPTMTAAHKSTALLLAFNVGIAPLPTAREYPELTKPLSSQSIPVMVPVLLPPNVPFNPCDVSQKADVIIAVDGTEAPPVTVIGSLLTLLLLVPTAKHAVLTPWVSVPVNDIAPTVHCVPAPAPVIEQVRELEPVVGLTTPIQTIVP